MCVCVFFSGTREKMLNLSARLLGGSPGDIDAPVGGTSLVRSPIEVIFLSFLLLLLASVAESPRAPVSEQISMKVGELREGGSTEPIKGR